MRPAALRIAFALCLLAVAGRSGAQIVPTGFTDSIVISGLDLPTAFEILPDGRVLAVEQLSANVRLAVNGVLGPNSIVLSVPDVTNNNERGLLGIAADPAFPAKPYIYTHQTEAGDVIKISR